MNTSLVLSARSPSPKLTAPRKQEWMFHLDLGQNVCSFYLRKDLISQHLPAKWKNLSLKPTPIELAYLVNERQGLLPIVVVNLPHLFNALYRRYPLELCHLLLLIMHYLPQLCQENGPFHLSKVWEIWRYFSFRIIGLDSTRLTIKWGNQEIARIDKGWD